jgi:hypothetical protein
MHTDTVPMADTKWHHLMEILSFHDIMSHWTKSEYGHRGPIILLKVQHWKSHCYLLASLKACPAKPFLNLMIDYFLDSLFQRNKFVLDISFNIKISDQYSLFWQSRSLASQEYPNILQNPCPQGPSTGLYPLLD